MGIQVKVLQKGKITIPAEIREVLGIKEGDTLVLETRGGHIVLIPPRTVARPTELLNGLLEGVTVREPVKSELKRAAPRPGKKLKRSEDEVRRR